MIKNSFFLPFFLLHQVSTCRFWNAFGHAKRKMRPVTPWHTHCRSFWRQNRVCVRVCLCVCALPSPSPTPIYLPRSKHAFSRTRKKRAMDQRTDGGTLGRMAMKSTRWGHSLLRSLVRSHRSLIRLLRTACFAHALRYAHSFVRSLTYSLWGSWGRGFCLWIELVDFIP